MNTTTTNHTDANNTTETNTNTTITPTKAPGLSHTYVISGCLGGVFVLIIIVAIACVKRSLYKKRSRPKKPLPSLEVCDTRHSLGMMDSDVGSSHDRGSFSERALARPSDHDLYENTPEPVRKASPGPPPAPHFHGYVNTRPADDCVPGPPLLPPAAAAGRNDATDPPPPAPHTHKYVNTPTLANERVKPPVAAKPNRNPVAWPFPPATPGPEAAMTPSAGPPQTPAYVAIFPDPAVKDPAEPYSYVATEYPCPSDRSEAQNAQRSDSVCSMDYYNVPSEWSYQNVDTKLG